MTGTPKDLSLEELIKLGEQTVNFWSKINRRKRDGELTYEEGYRGYSTWNKETIMEVLKVTYGSAGCAYTISAFKEFSEGNAILGSAGHDEEILKDFYDKVSQTTEKRIKQKIDTEKYLAIRETRDIIRHKIKIMIP